MELDRTLTLLHADGRVECLPGASADVELDAETVRITARTAFAGCVRLEVALPATDDPRWMIPGLVYGDVRPGPLATIESSEWSFRCDRAATTAVFGRSEDGVVALHVDEASELGEHGIGFAHVDGVPVLRAHWPMREEPMSYAGGEQARPPQVAAHPWRAGESHTLRAALHRDKDYAQVIREAHVLHAPSGPAAWVSVEEAAALAAHGLHRWHYRAHPPRLVETAAFDRSRSDEDRDAMHVSWVSGVPFAHALLRHGRRIGSHQYIHAALGVLDFVADDLTPGGTFWGQWTHARGWSHGWHPDQRRLHSRTLGDAALFLARALRDEPNRPNWQHALRSNLEAVVRGQRDDGALPAALDVVDGSPRDWLGTSGLAWIPPLVLGAELLDEPRWADAARRAGAYFLEAVHADELLGAPEDVATAPTSEDGYMAVMAYVALDRHDARDERWLDAARRAADFTHTFRYTYDVAFDADTDLGRHGFRTRGADQASPTNQHVHSYGLVALPEWAHLSRRLDDDHYLVSAREHLDCFRQLVARHDGDFGAMRGMVAERYFQTDYIEPKGTLGPLSHAWCVGLLLHACEDAIEDPALAYPRRSSSMSR